MVEKMVAIRLNSANLGKIVDSSDFREEDSKNMSDAALDWRTKPYYFIPEYRVRGGETSRGWMVFPEDMLKSEFDFDRRKAQENFVELTRK